MTHYQVMVEHKSKSKVWLHADDENHAARLFVDTKSIASGQFVVVRVYGSDGEWRDILRREASECVSKYKYVAPVPPPESKAQPNPEPESKAPPSKATFMESFQSLTTQPRRY